jgi:hypothetical protein
VTITSRSLSGTPASLEACMTRLLTSCAGTASMPSLEMISSTALWTTIHDQAAIIPEYAA